jgi:hypothetical protein
VAGFVLGGCEPVAVVVDGGLAALGDDELHALATARPAASATTGSVLRMSAES